MRFWLAVVVVLAGISVSGVAQQNNTFKVKPSAHEKAPRRASVPIGKTAANPNSKDLQNLERQTAKSSAPPRSAGKRTPGTGSSELKPVKDKPNPPINFGGTRAGGKRAGSTKGGSDPYAGRLKQKGSAHR